MQPRDIPEFIESISKLQVDKIWLKYFPLDQAAPISRRMFLEREQYTHYVTTTDDVIITQKEFDILKQDAENYDIISGWFNGNTTFGKDDSNISITHLPPETPHTAKYEDYHFTSISELDHLLKTGTEIIKIKHSGFALPFISRKVIEQIEFRTDYGCCRDACFSNDIAKAGIEQYCDLRAGMKHLKKDDTVWEPLQVGKHDKQIVFDNAQ